MKKRAFTLVELLTVIIILGVLMGVAVRQVMIGIKESRNKAYDVLIKSVEDSGELYMADHAKEYADLNLPGSNIYIYLDDLIDDGYLDYPVINPKTKEEIDRLTPIRISVIDTGNIKVTFLTDMVGPQIAFSRSGTTGYYKSSSTVVSVSNEPADELDNSSLKYQWTTSYIQPAQETFVNTFINNRSISTPEGVSGEYYLWIIAADINGNITIDRTDAFRLDNTVPNTPAIPDLAAADDTGYNDADDITNKTTVLLSGTGAEANRIVYFNNNDVDYSSSVNATVAADGTWSKSISITANTVNHVKIRLKDEANNYSAYSNTLDITVDTSNPTVTLSRNPALGNWTFGDVTITPTCSDNVGGVGIYSCSPAVATQTAGQYDFTAVDEAGNSATASATVSSRTMYRYHDNYVTFTGSCYLKSAINGIYGTYVNSGNSPFIFETGVVFNSKSANFYLFDIAESDGDPRFALWYRASSARLALYSYIGGTEFIDTEYNFNPTLGTYYVIKIEGGTDASRGYALTVNGSYIGTTGSTTRFSGANQATYIGRRYTAIDYLRGTMYYFYFQGPKSGVGDVSNRYYGQDNIGNQWFPRANPTDSYRIDNSGCTLGQTDWSDWSTTQPHVYNNTDDYFRTWQTDIQYN